MRLVENSGTRPFVTDGMRGERNATWGQEGDHDEASVRMDGVTEECSLSRKESAAYARNNEPHLK